MGQSLIVWFGAARRSLGGKIKQAYLHVTLANKMVSSLVANQCYPFNLNLSCPKLGMLRPLNLSFFSR
jgi:hypothetical protein